MAKQATVKATVAVIDPIISMWIHMDESNKIEASYNASKTDLGVMNDAVRQDFHDHLVNITPKPVMAAIEKAEVGSDVLEGFCTVMESTAQSLFHPRWADKVGDTFINPKSPGGKPVSTKREDGSFKYGSIPMTIKEWNVIAVFRSFVKRLGWSVVVNGGKVKSNAELTNISKSIGKGAKAPAVALTVEQQIESLANRLYLAMSKADLTEGAGATLLSNISLKLITLQLEQKQAKSKEATKLAKEAAKLAASQAPVVTAVAPAVSPEMADMMAMMMKMMGKK